MQVTANTQAKYTLSSKAFTNANWTCTSNATLCKAVGVVTVSTLGSRVFVPDGPTTITLFATYNTLNDGKSNRFFQSRITSFSVVNNQGKQTFPITTKVLGVNQLANTGFPWGYTHAPIVSNMPLDPVNGTWKFSTSHFVAGTAAKTANVTGKLGVQRTVGCEMPAHASEGSA